MLRTTDEHSGTESCQLRKTATFTMTVASYSCSPQDKRERGSYNVAKTCCY